MATLERAHPAEFAEPIDERAFADLVRAHSRMFYAAARAILKSDQDAQDCVQDAILQGWRKLPTLRNRAHVSTWLTRIVINTAINMLRRRKPTAPLLMEVPAKREHADERLDIRRAIESLDRMSRLVTVLYYFEDLSISDIARFTGMREGSVKSRLFRARKALREILEGYDHAEQP